jgi:hypothetical protein
MKYIFSFFLLFIYSIVTAQKLTIAGYVQDRQSGEKLVNVSLWSPLLGKGTNTNNFGYFTLTIPQDTVSLVISALGYKPRLEFFDQTNTDSILTFTLEKLPRQEEIAVVTGRRRVSIERRTNMGQINVPVEIIQSLPRFLGEPDVLKTLQLLPGVQQATEGTAGFVVRGGSPDQNLILLDGLPLYNTQHLFGIFSTFNADVLKNVELYKGGFPARFGGRLSSVVDVVTKDGNMKEWHGEIGAGLIMSRFTVEGPIKKDKTSIMIGGRRSYLDILAQPFVKNAAREEDIDINFRAYLYDLNLKVNHILSSKDRIYFSFFSSQDFLKFKVGESFTNNTINTKLRVGYGTVVSSVRWNHIFNKRLFANTTLGFTNYRFITDATFEENNSTSKTSFFAKYFSGIKDFSLSSNLEYRPNAKNNIKFGGYLIAHDFKPGVTSFKITDNSSVNVDTVINPTIQNSLELGTYAENDMEITDKFKVNYGFHFNLFQSKNKNYPTLQPRLSARYLLPQSWAIKAGYSQMAQSIHLLTNNTTTLPTDLWVPSTDKIKPMKSSQVALGIAKTIWGGKWEASVEGYYKTMNGVIEYKDGASYLNANSDSWDNKVEQGNGWARGVEFLLQKSVGRTKGWLGYTLSKTDRQFNNLNFGKKFPYKYDRRHDLEVVVTHKINKNWEISGSWGFSTAIANSLPSATYASTNLSSPYNNQFYYSNIDYYNGRNGFRLLNYHRLDGSISWSKQKKKYERTWNLSVYNMYNRKNPFYYYINYDYNTGAGKVKSITLLPLIPNLSWIIKF